jgi:hypothetical protein
MDGEELDDSLTSARRRGLNSDEMTKNVVD